MQFEQISHQKIAFCLNANTKIAVKACRFSDLNCPCCTQDCSKLCNFMGVFYSKWIKMFVPAYRCMRHSVTHLALTGSETWAHIRCQKWTNHNVPTSNAGRMLPFIPNKDNGSELMKLPMGIWSIMVPLVPGSGFIHQYKAVTLGRAREGCPGPRRIAMFYKALFMVIWYKMSTRSHWFCYPRGRISQTIRCIFSI